MSAFPTSLGSKSAVIQDPNLIQLHVGTVQIASALGATFGTIVSAELDRTADLKEIMGNNGDIVAAVFSNGKHLLKVSGIFSNTMQLSGLPGIAFQVMIPLIGRPGWVTNAKVKWERAGERMYEFDATCWDGLAGGQLQYWNGNTYTNNPA